MLQEQMVSTGQGDETGAGDAGGQLASRLEWNHLVIPHVHDERRRLHSGKQVDDIEIIDDIEITSGALGEVVFSCSWVK